LLNQALEGSVVAVEKDNLEVGAAFEFAKYADIVGRRGRCGGKSGRMVAMLGTLRYKRGIVREKALTSHVNLGLMDAGTNGN